MRVHWWSADNPFGLRNLGDWLSVPILRALGHEPEPPAPGEPCLFACGSIIGHTHAAHCGASRVVVWGSGVMNGDALDPFQVPARYAAVRGPITRDALDLPPDIPMADPVFALPSLVPLPPPPELGEVLYVGHCGNAVVCPPGFDAGVTMLTTEEAALKLAARIAAARFVASESLHGCILACAYGVPWALASAAPWAFGPRSKYNGFMLSVGLPPVSGFLPADLGACRAWWERTGRHARPPAIVPLLDVFPHVL